MKQPEEQDDPLWNRLPTAITKHERNAIKFITGFVQHWASEWGGHKNKTIDEAARVVAREAGLVHQWLQHMEATKSLDQLIVEVYEWQQATFTDATEQGRIAHFLEEIDEYLADPSNEIEAADVFMLFVAIFMNRRIDLRSAVERKLEICKKRTYVKVAGGYSKHVKEEDQYE